MAGLAKALQYLGWEVSGSDHVNVYPPSTTYLEKYRIKYARGYRRENLTDDYDLVVVGRSALMLDPKNPEYFRAKELGCPVISFPELVQKYVVKENSIVIAGTYGKSTTTALIVWILMKAGYNPSYLIGDEAFNFDDNIKITESEYSVVEGDETPSLMENDPPKFMFYKPKYLLLTATEYDHPEIYKTKEDYIDAYIKLVEILPKDGVLFYESGTVDKRVIDACMCQKIKFLNNTEVEIDERFKESALRAITLCNFLGIEANIIRDSVSTFKGLRGRLDYLGKSGGRFLYYDFSQQSSKVKMSLQMLRKMHKENRIIVIFNPSATSLKYKTGLRGYTDAFLGINEVIIAKVNFISAISGEDRVTGPDLVEAFGGTNKVAYVPVNEKIVEWIVQNTKAEDVVIFMSSGGLEFTYLIERVKAELGIKGGTDGSEV